MRIDVAPIKELIQWGELEGVEWIDNIEQAANGLPKVGRRKSLMFE